MPTSASERLAERERRKKEREYMEAAAEQRLKEEKEAAEKRAAEKKARDEERKRQEEAEAEKAAKDAAETAAAKAAAEAAAAAAEAATEEMNNDKMEVEDQPNANINDFINDINSGGETGSKGGGEETEPITVESEEEEVRSPVKKKKRKDKKKKSKGEKKGGEESILKKGRFTKGAEETKKTAAQEESKTAKAAAKARVKAKEAEEKKKARELHVHQFGKVVVECSVICSQEDINLRYNELPQVVRVLFKNLQKVDKFVCLVPVEEGEGEKIWEVADIPFDHTDLGNWVMHSGGQNAFELKKPKKNNKKEENVNEEDEDWLMPEIYFTLAFACDKDPERLMERVRGEWAKTGGKKLYEKEIASFTTKTAVNFFHLRNDNSPETILAEVKMILEEARLYAEVEDQETYERYEHEEFPELGLRKIMPKIPGQDTKVFQGWSGRQHDMRKTLHLEAEEESVPFLHYLTQTAKNKHLFEKVWGRKTRVVLIFDNKGKRKGTHQTQSMMDMAAVASFNRKHINYQSSTRTDGLPGILHLDKAIPFYAVSDPTQVKGTITLRKVLYQHFKMLDGHSLFEDVHQASAMGPVEVVVPNCEESERMLLMMQKNTAAYITFYLLSKSPLPERVVKDIVRGTMDPIFVNEIDKCIWNDKDWVLSTSADEENEKLKEIEEAAWYKDEFGDHMVDISRKEKRQYANKEALDELNCEHSYKSVHQRKGNYVGLPHAPAFQLGSNSKAGQAEGEEDGKSKVNQQFVDDTEFENLSPEELIALLKKHNISPKAVGSPPNSARSGSGSGAEEDESSEGSSASSSSASSSSGGSVLSVEMEKSSPSSDEGDTKAHTPGQGE